MERGPSQERQASFYFFTLPPWGTWLSSHDCPNLELRHHQKFAVIAAILLVFYLFSAAKLHIFF
jgi:hypothetical protein